MWCYIAVWNVKEILLSFKNAKLLKQSVGHYASLTDTSQTDFAYLAADYIELEFLSK